MWDCETGPQSGKHLGSIVDTAFEWTQQTDGTNRCHCHHCCLRRTTGPGPTSPWPARSPPCCSSCPDWMRRSSPRRRRQCSTCRRHPTVRRCPWCCRCSRRTCCKVSHSSHCSTDPQRFRSSAWCSSCSGRTCCKTHHRRRRRRRRRRHLWAFTHTWAGAT